MLQLIRHLITDLYTVTIGDAIEGLKETFRPEPPANVIFLKGCRAEDRKHEEEMP